MSAPDRTLSERLRGVAASEEQYWQEAGEQALLREAAERIETLETALQRIEANARDWHGPEGSGGGYERALGVIAEWCREALAAAREAARG